MSDGVTPSRGVESAPETNATAVAPTSQVPRGRQPYRSTSVKDEDIAIPELAHTAHGNDVVERDSFELQHLGLRKMRNRPAVAETKLARWWNKHVHVSVSLEKCRDYLGTTAISTPTIVPPIISSVPCFPCLSLLHLI